MRAAQRAPVPRDLLAEVRRDNRAFLTSRTAHGDPAYFEFLRQLFERSGGGAAVGGAPRHSAAAALAAAGCQAEAMAGSGSRGLLAHLACAVLVRSVPPAASQRARLAVWVDSVKGVLCRAPLVCAALLQSALAAPSALVGMLLGDESGSGVVARTGAKTTGERGDARATRLRKKLQRWTRGRCFSSAARARALLPLR
jgi:hypothetical protein